MARCQLYHVNCSARRRSADWWIGLSMGGDGQVSAAQTGALGSSLIPHFLASTSHLCLCLHPLAAVVVAVGYAARKSAMVPWPCPPAGLAAARAMSCNHIVLYCIDDAHSTGSETGAPQPRGRLHVAGRRAAPPPHSRCHAADRGWICSPVAALHTRTPLLSALADTIFGQTGSETLLHIRTPLL